MSNYEEELTCPILCELMNDPICLPCCGRVISRQALLLDSSSDCPLCKASLSNFDATNAPKVVNIAYMVDIVKNSSNTLFEEEKTEENVWTAKIVKLSNKNLAYQTVIGRLEIKNKNYKTNLKTLLVPVIDVSGSMSGSPMKQVEYSLNRVLDMTFSKNHLITDIIFYSDNAKSVFIDKSFTKTYHQEKSIKDNLNGGGTSFVSAFLKITDICKKYNNNDDITELHVVFMTDGQDSSVRNNDYKSIKNLQDDINKYWKKKIMVHTIGFAKEHDFELLTKLNKIGNIEGAYRYADPSEDTDSLSNKINSVLDVITKSPEVPIKLINNKFEVFHTNNNKFWLNLTNQTDKLKFTVLVDNKEIQIQGEKETEVKEEEVWNEWYSFLVDQCVDEILVLSKQDISIEKEFHIELIEKRCNSILSELLSYKFDTERLNKVLEMVSNIKKNLKIDSAKINDIKFEGTYTTSKSTQIKKTSRITFSSTNDEGSKKMHIKNKTPWETDYNSYRLSNSQNTELFDIFNKSATSIVMEYIKDKNIKDICDDNGSNLLMLAARHGNISLVKHLLSLNIFDINQSNNFGLTALDLAAIQGFWISTELLHDDGGKSNMNTDTLLRTCLSKEYVNTSDMLIKKKICKITNNMIESAPNNTILCWLNNKNDKCMNIELAISKGVYSIVKENIDTLNNISMEPYLDIFYKTTDDYLKIVELLLENKKINPDEIIKINDNEITWPLFMACEKGNYSMFQILIKYVSHKNLDMQNNKGTTCLWIACCNSNIDIVTELLNLGVNANINNIKGDNALIPICQKGNNNLLDILLMSNINIVNCNKNGDNAVIIACRTGQHKILEKLLKSIKKESMKNVLEHKANIDGFNCLLAAVEQDKIHCIEICNRCGADLEFKTDTNNNIISGATALHLACYYGKLNSVIKLCELGCDMIAIDYNGNNALHISINKGFTDIIKFLMKHNSSKTNLSVKNKDNKLPAYYATLKGNELIYEEFFTNKLLTIMNKIMSSDSIIEEKCSDILVKYGKSYGCYECDDIKNATYNNGENLLTYAILNNNKHLINTLKNMNMNTPDHYGIKPSFWGCYLGLDGFEIPDDETKIMLGKVEGAKTSIQNKFLLNISDKISMIEYTDKIDPIFKMNDGFISKIEDGVLVNLKKSNDQKISLLGFIDKIKKYLPSDDIKNSFDLFVYSAKINAIKLIASDESILEPVHLIALYMYTENITIFKKVNTSLLNWTTDNQWNPFIFCLYQSISLIKPFVGEVYRGIEIDFNSNDFKINTEIVWKTFSTCYSTWNNVTNLLDNKKGIIFIIKSVTGRKISRYSRYPVDSEVVFLPETKFIVKNIYKPNIFVLGQENIRESTYKATEKDIEKAEFGKDCIIIQLVEQA